MGLQPTNTLGRRKRLPLVFAAESPYVGRTVVMAISEPEFRKLLFATPAVEAVNTLMDFWSARSSPSESHLRLTRPEYVATLVVRYRDGVRRGGHRELLATLGGGAIPDTIGALDAIELPQARRILVDACGVFPGAHVPIRPDEVELFFEDCFQSVFAYLLELDTKLNAVAVEERILGYLQANVTEVLRAERGHAS